MRNATVITSVLPTSGQIPCVLGFGLTSHFGELKIPNAFAGSEPSDRGGFSANQSKNCIFEAVKIRLNQLYVLFMHLINQIVCTETRGATVTGCAPVVSFCCKGLY